MKESLVGFWQHTDFLSSKVFLGACCLSLERSCTAREAEHTACNPENSSLTASQSRETSWSRQCCWGKTKQTKLKGILASLVALLLALSLEERQPQKIIAGSLAKFEVDFIGLFFRLSIVSGCGELPEIVSAFQKVSLLPKTVISLEHKPLWSSCPKACLQSYKQACVLKNAVWGSSALFHVCVPL